MSLLATHVGSLPRSQAVVDYLFTRERGEVFDQKAFDACMILSAMVKPQKSATPPMSKTATLALTATARAMRLPI